MPLARCNLVIQDEDGNIIDGASVEVRRETSGAPLVTVYSDRAGTLSLGSTFVAADGADAGFHVAGGAYKITASKAGFERIWRYVAVGTSQETDVGAQFSPRGVYSGATIYSLLDLVTDQGASFVYINATASAGNAPPTLPTTSNSYWQLIAEGGGDGDDGAPGDDGSRIFAQATAPSTAYPDGSLWIDSDSTDVDVYELEGSPQDWVDTGINLKGAQGDPFAFYATVATFALRNTADAAPEGSLVLVEADETQGGVAWVYTKLSDGSPTEWSAGFAFVGAGTGITMGKAIAAAIVFG